MATAQSEPRSPARTIEDFEAWVQPHLPAMSGLAHRLVPDESADVVQEALMTAWRNRDRFDPHRGTPLSWLLMLTANCAARHHRRVRRRPVVLTERPLDVAADDEQADLDLRGALNRLSPRQRLAVSLRYYLDLPVAEVAAAMGCAEGTAKSTLSDARAALRRHLEAR